MLVASSKKGGSRSGKCRATSMSWTAYGAHRCSMLWKRLVLLVPAENSKWAHFIFSKRGWLDPQEEIS